jgi:hypothetical protein
MSLPARQQRVIDHMEGALRAGEPQLAAARLVTRTPSEQALSPPSRAEATAGNPSRVC